MKSNQQEPVHKTKKLWNSRSILITDIKTQHDICSDYFYGAERNNKDESNTSSLCKFSRINSNLVHKAAIGAINTELPKQHQKILPGPRELQALLSLPSYPRTPLSCPGPHIFSPEATTLFPCANKDLELS